MEELHLVVPDTLRDPLQPSGGNIYDHELATALTSLRVRVHEHSVPGAWPRPTDGMSARLAPVLAGLPDEATVLVDGLVGLDAADALSAERTRLRLWHLVHLPLALSADHAADVRSREHAALTAAAGVITTSSWTRRWLLATYGLDPATVHVATPGAHAAALGDARPDGTRLVCVGSVLPAKGQDVLVDALAALVELPWTCRLVGPLDRDPTFVDQLQKQIRSAGLSDRVQLVGTVSRAEVGDILATSDLLVLPTLLEMFGMVVTEALAQGVPVVASDTGGVAEALGRTADGRKPGVLVSPGSVTALGDALNRWLTDAAHREGLRGAARARRGLLDDWSTTARSVLGALS